MRFGELARCGANSIQQRAIPWDLRLAPPGFTESARPEQCDRVATADPPTKGLQPGRSKFGRTFVRAAGGDH